MISAWAPKMFQSAVPEDSRGRDPACEDEHLLTGRASPVSMDQVGVGLARAPGVHGSAGMSTV